MVADHPQQTVPLLVDDETSFLADSDWKQSVIRTYAAKSRIIIRWILSLTLIRPAHSARYFRRFGYALVPQLLRSLIWEDRRPPTKQFSTSYLSGLRGCTALKVFTFHYIHALSDIGFQPWGTNERHRYVLEMPIIRYFYSGFTSHIFFGVAGYLTSIRLLQLMDSPDPLAQAKVLATVSSSLFRRAFRLYLPVFIITFITATWIYLGFYEHNRPYLLDHVKYFPGDWNETKPLRYPTYGEQLKFWSSEMYDLTNICTEKTVYPFHDQHLWSILSEMRASLHLYGCLLALAQCTRHVRLICFFVLTGLYFFWNHWEIWVYMLGAAVAQIDIILTEYHQQKKLQQQQQQQTPLPTSLIEEKSPSVTETELPTNSNLSPSIIDRLATMSSRHLALPSFRFFFFLLAFYFLSYPIDGSRDYAPGYMTLNLIIPEWMLRKDKFYPNIGTAIFLFLLVRADPSSSRWRQLLNSPIPQYMGTISFGFYLCHGPIMHLGGYMIPHWVWWKWLGLEGGGQTTDGQWIVGILCGWACTLVVSLWAGDVWTREVEGRCIRLVKRLETASFRKKQR